MIPKANAIPLNDTSDTQNSNSLLGLCKQTKEICIPNEDLEMKNH